MNNNRNKLVNTCVNAPLAMDDTRRRWREKNKCLSCLPIEILLIILSYLSVGDYVSFRSVCKSWQSAFVEYSPLISQKAKRRKGLPWFVLLKLDPNSKELETTGKIGDLSNRRIYTTGIPELSGGSRILSSKHGWLLLFSNRVSPSLFFLNPFSRARIDIPNLLVDELTCPAFDTSAPPTSPDCVVFIVESNCKGEDDDARRMMKISTCCRGEGVWQTNTYNIPGHTISRVVNTVFSDGVWYCLHERGSFSTFDVVSRVWRIITTPIPGIAREERLVSHVCKRGNRVYLCIYGDYFCEVPLLKKKKIEEKKRLGVSRSYSSNPNWQLRYEYFIRTSPERAFLQLHDRELKVDTFNTRAWCIDISNKDKTRNTTGKDNDGGEGITFRWHGFKSWADDFFSLSEFKNRCSRRQEDGQNDNDHCSTFIMWLEPTWVHPSTDLTWMS